MANKKTQCWELSRLLEAGVAWSIMEYRCHLFEIESPIKPIYIPLSTSQWDYWVEKMKIWDYPMK